MTAQNLNQAYSFSSTACGGSFPLGVALDKLRPPFPVLVLSFPQLLGICASRRHSGGFLVCALSDCGLVRCRSSDGAALRDRIRPVWVRTVRALPQLPWRSASGAGLVIAHGAPARLLLAIGIARRPLFTWQAPRPRAVDGEPRARLDGDRQFPTIRARHAAVRVPQSRRRVRRAGQLPRDARFTRRRRLAKSMGSVNWLAPRREGAPSRGLAAFGNATRAGLQALYLPFQRGSHLLAVAGPRTPTGSYSGGRDPRPDARLVLLQLGSNGALGRNAEASGPSRRQRDRREPQGRPLPARVSSSPSTSARARSLERLVKAMAGRCTTRARAQNYA